MKLNKQSLYNSQDNLFLKRSKISILNLLKQRGVKWVKINHFQVYQDLKKLKFIKSNLP